MKALVFHEHLKRAHDVYPPAGETGAVKVVLSRNS